MERHSLLTRLDVGQSRPAHSARFGDPLLRKVALAAKPTQGLAELAVFRLDI